MCIITFLYIVYAIVDINYDVKPCKIYISCKATNQNCITAILCRTKSVSVATKATSCKQILIFNELLR